MSLLLPAERAVVLSTGHIPQRTALALGQPAAGIDHHDACKAAELWSLLSYTGYEFGWLIWVQACEDGVMDGLRRDHAELAGLMELARAQGATLLRLGCDGELVQGLPTFDW